MYDKGALLQYPTSKTVKIHKSILVRGWVGWINFFRTPKPQKISPDEIRKVPKRKSDPDTTSKKKIKSSMKSK